MTDNGVIKVLLVEDCKTDALIVRSALAKSASKFEVCHVETLREAISALAKERFQVVLTDLGLPDATGLKTMRRLKNSCSGIPIIVLTGNEDEQAGAEALREGAEDYLVKGELNGRALARSVRFAIEKAQIREQLVCSQRLETVGKLAGGIAHDFNNLLNVILLNLDLVDEMQTDEPLDEIMAEIGKAARTAADLTSQLLTFSRRQVMTLRVVEVNQVIRDFERILRSALGPNIPLTLLLDEKKLCVEADYGMLEQVFLNLVLNARDALEGKGAVFIETSLETGESEEPSRDDPLREFVEISVRDTGPGIPVAVRERIWEPFFTTKAISRGTGLGLSTVMSIVQQHGGQIELLPTREAGAQFVIRLPSVEQTEDPIPEPLGIVNEAKQKSTVTVMLVEDEASIRNLVARTLSRSGYKVFAARNAKEALSLWEEFASNVDILVTDLSLGSGLNGRALSYRILEERPGLPVLYISGYSSEFEDSDFRLVEGENFLSKPFSLKSLLSRIEIMSGAQRGRGAP
jgi:signal transduction histidine kinase